jgi:hypothetical protein
MLHDRHAFALSVCEGFPFQVSADHLLISQDWIVESTKLPLKLEKQSHFHLGSLLTPIYDEVPTIITFLDAGAKTFDDFHQFFLTHFSEALKGSYVVGYFNRIKGHQHDFSLALFHQELEESLAVTKAFMTEFDVKRAYVYQQQSGLLLVEAE